MKRISTLLILSSCLSALLFGVNLHLNFKGWLHSWGQGLQLTVYVPSEISDLTHIKNSIGSIPAVSDVKIVTPQETLAEFQVQMASLGGSMLSTDELVQAIPPSLLVNLKKEFENDSRLDLIHNTVAAIQKIPGVESVDYGQDWVEQFSSLVKGLAVLWYSLGGLLLFTVGTLIFNSLRVMTLERRDEIEVLELLGADRYFIQKPFIREGALLGFIGATLAVGINFLIFSLLRFLMAKNPALADLSVQVKNIGLSLGLSSLVIGLAVGALSAYASVRKLNTGWSAAGNS